jgi:hypothetical protein
MNKNSATAHKPQKRANKFHGQSITNRNFVSGTLLLYVNLIIDMKKPGKMFW